MITNAAIELVMVEKSFPMKSWSPRSISSIKDCLTYVRTYRNSIFNRNWYETVPDRGGMEFNI